MLFGGKLYSFMASEYLVNRNTKKKKDGDTENEVTSILR